jgi:hypothetical protein
MKFLGKVSGVGLRSTLPLCRRPANFPAAASSAAGGEKPAAGDAKAALASAKGAVTSGGVTVSPRGVAVTSGGVTVTPGGATVTSGGAALTTGEAAVISRGATVTSPPETAGFAPFSSKTGHFRLKPRFQPPAAAFEAGSGGHPDGSHFAAFVAAIVKKTNNSTDTKSDKKQI